MRGYATVFVLMALVIGFYIGGEYAYQNDLCKSAHKGTTEEKQ